MGVSGIAPGRNINAMDGLLDVLIITDASFSSLVDIGESLLEQRAPKNYIHYQGKQIHIEADPPQPVQVDGEMAGESPISIQVVPQALGVLVAAK